MHDSSERRARELYGIVHIPDSSADHDSAMHQALQGLHERLKGMEGRENERRKREEERRAPLDKIRVGEMIGKEFI